ncbi:hypothetical protein V8E54_003015 [Elaphomyces granulatus]
MARTPTVLENDKEFKLFGKTWVMTGINTTQAKLFLVRGNQRLEFAKLQNWQAAMRKCLLQLMEAEFSSTDSLDLMAKWYGGTSSRQLFGARKGGTREANESKGWFSTFNRQNQYEKIKAIIGAIWAASLRCFGYPEYRVEWESQSLA